MSHDDKSGVFGLLCGDRLLHCTTLCKGTLPEKKYFLFRSLPELSPPPSFQATSTSISKVKNDVCVYVRKIPIMTMTVVIIITMVILMIMMTKNYQITMLGILGKDLPILGTNIW